MSQLSDLDAAIADQKAAITAEATAINTKRDDLQAKLTAALAGQPVDLSKEIADIRANTSALQAIGETAPAPVPAPTPAPAA